TQALRRASTTPAAIESEDEPQTIPPTLVSSPSLNMGPQVHPAVIQPPVMPPPHVEARERPAPVYTPAMQSNPLYQPAAPATPYPVASGRRPPWWLFVVIPLLLVLFVGGMLIGLHINRRTSPTT